MIFWWGGATKRILTLSIDGFVLSGFGSMSIGSSDLKIVQNGLIKAIKLSLESVGEC